MKFRDYVIDFAREAMFVPPDTIIPPMICNKKLQSLFDAALRATEEPNVKRNLPAPRDHTSPAPGLYAPSEEGGVMDERGSAPQESISFAPAFWKTAL